MARGRVDPGLGAVPAAAHGLVQGNHITHRVASTEQVAVLQFEQRTLGIEHPLEIRIAFAVQDDGQVQRAFGRAFGLAQDAFALQSMGQAVGGIIRFASRLAHLVTVGLDQLLQARILDPHVVADTAMVEHVPAQTGSADQIKTARRTAQGIGRPDNAAQQRQRRIEIAFGHANQCGLRGDIQFGGAHVRAAQQQIGRHVLQHGTVHQRNQPGALDDQRQCAGWLPDQHGQGIAGARYLVFQAGDGAQGAEVLGLGPLQVELGGLAAFEQLFGDLVVA